MMTSTGGIQRVARPYNEIGKLVLNPRGKDIKIETYSSFILAILTRDEYVRGLRVERIAGAIETSFGLKNLSRLIIDETLRILEGRGILASTPSGWCLTPNGKAEVERLQAHAAELFARMVDAVVSSVQSRVGFALDAQQAAMTRGMFEGALYEVFDAISRSTAGYISSFSSTVVLAQIASALATQGKKYDESIIEKASEIKQALGPSVTQLFYAPTPEISEALLQTSTKHVMWRVLGADPELASLKENLLRGAEVLLDTNILIAGIFEASHDHEQTGWFLEATRQAGASLAVSNFTLREFRDALKFADDLYRRSVGKTIDLRVLNNEITKTYIDFASREQDWDTYLASKRDAIQEFLGKWSIRQIDGDAFEIKSASIASVREILRESVEDPYHPKANIVLEHDARNILLIQKLREKSPELAFGSPWFLTRDFHLRRADSLVAQRHGFPRRSTISPATWFEIVYPFVWTTVDPGRASEIFARIAASSLAPIPTPSFESFITYVSRELAVAGQAEDRLRRIIQNSHLQRVLQRDVELGNTAGAVATLQEILLTVQKVEERGQARDATVDRLAQKVQELENRSPQSRIRLSPTEWTVHVAKLAVSGTPQEKGRTLEEFAEYLIRCLPGMRIVDRDVRLEAEELDLLVSNYGFAAWGDPILVECKNWSEPVGAREIVVFSDKLEGQRAQTGFFLAAQGVTGSEQRDARLKVREALLNKGVRILVLTTDDFKQVHSAESLWNLLEQRYYLPSKPPPD